MTGSTCSRASATGRTRSVITGVIAATPPAMRQLYRTGVRPSSGRPSTQNPKSTGVPGLRSAGDHRPQVRSGDIADPDPRTSRVRGDQLPHLGGRRRSPKTRPID
jgi:hypothetical protein